LSSHIGLGALFCRLYLTPKKGNAAYEQQCDVIIKLEHFLLLALLIIFMTQPFFVKFINTLKKNLFVIGIQGQLRNHHQVQGFYNDDAKFKF
jgi:hypothetical protein